jgi:hypothetical protein
MLEKGEIVLHEEGASHFHKYIAVGGKMKLTSTRLLFCSHVHNTYNHELALQLKDIVSVEFFKSMLINPNGIAILLRNGDIENFIVDDRKIWKSRIEQMITERA